MRLGAKAWAALGLGILAYEGLCPDGELLSEQCDRWLESYPVSTRAAIAVVALHLANGLPDRFDLVHWVGVGLRRPASARGSKWPVRYAASNGATVR